MQWSFQLCEASLQGSLDLLLELLEPLLGVERLGGVHLVDGHDELLDAEGVGEQGVLPRLPVLGDAGLELSSPGGDDEDSAVGLAGARDHVQLIFSYLSCSLIWEFEGCPVIWLQVAGTRPPIISWSGIDVRNWSNFSLNSCTPHLEIFLKYFGNALKSLGPCDWNVLTFCLPLRVGIAHFQPILSEMSPLVLIPQLAANPLKTFQVYIILYLSNLLCWEIIFRCSSGFTIELNLSF